MRTLMLVVCCAALALTGAAGTGWQSTDPDAREAAYRANNRGVALMEQYLYSEASQAFRQALARDTSLGIARFNLALALFHVPDIAAARSEAESAATALPDAPQPAYLLGLIAKAENRPDEALAAFERVLARDPRDVGANVNLGQLLTQLRRYEAALVALRRGFDAEPFNATAAYSLGMALTRSGDRAAGRAMVEEFQRLRASGHGTLLGESYLEQGRYAEAIASTGAESALVDTTVPAVRFVDASDRLPVDGPPPVPPPPLFGGRFASMAALAPALGGQLALFDADQDGDLDLVEVSASGTRLLRNEGGRFVATGAASGLAAASPGVAAVAGDVDGDAVTDLFVLEARGGRLYRGLAGGRFEDVTGAAGLEPTPGVALTCALSDVDHDGDLDLLIGGVSGAAGAAGRFPTDYAPATPRLWRNDGEGRFTDATAEAGLDVAARSVAIVPTDYDERRDVDLLFVSYGAAPTLMRNMRDGRFRNVADEVGLSSAGRYTGVAAGDLDKDGLVDFFFAAASGSGRFALSDGRGGFEERDGPAGLSGAGAAQFLDYDADGLLDLVALTASGPAVFRNLGDRFSDVTTRAVPATQAPPEPAAAGVRMALASGDLDGDGDTDLVARDAAGRLRLWRNEGGEARRSVAVRLTGRVSNRSGVGAKVEMRAGSLTQKLETYAASPAPAPADVLFGLGSRDGADAVRVLWPAGILQTEIGRGGGRVASPLAIQELDRKPSSCPYLYTWNGTSFEFVTDFMGGGEMGYWAAPGIRNTPDPMEYVRIRQDQLVARRGRWELRVTNELEEVLFLDGLRLHVVDHPARVKIHPTEGMTAVAREFELVAVRDPRPVRRAVDEGGRDLTAALAAIDRSYADGFGLLPLRGYAEEHALVLDLGRVGDDALLLLNGWTDYAFSSDNVAAAQRGWSLQPPSLQMRNAAGQWRTTIAEVGIPVGRPQTVVLDLAGRWLGPSRQVRLLTNMRVYWDQALVGARAQVETQTRVLEPTNARLGRRGYSAQVSPDGREPYLYDYARVSWDAPWKVFPGLYTREGDVSELLAPSDDLFVISRPGDEVALSFEALPAPPAGWSRTFLLYADGFSKEMDLNSATPDALGPLPFHAMSGYPYGAEEAFPATPERLAVMQRYNTRLVRELLPSIDWSALAGRRASTAAAQPSATDAPP